MKHAFWLLIIAWGCTPAKSLDTNEVADGYLVDRIKSVDNWYFIYARKSDVIYKIVSKKEPGLKCTRINVNKRYAFALESLWHTMLS